MGASSISGWSLVASILLVATISFNIYTTHRALAACKLRSVRNPARRHAVSLAAPIERQPAKGLSTLQQLVDAAVKHNSGLRLTAPPNATQQPVSLFDRRDRTSSKGDWDEVVAFFPPGIVLSITYAGQGYVQIMTNWVLHHRKLGIPYVVAVLDNKTATYCQEHGFTWVWAHRQLAAEDFRRDFKAMRFMGSVKPKITADFLRRNKFSAVVISDTDVSWLCDPAGLIKAHPAADVMVSTDCNSAEAEANKTMNFNRCGLNPGSWYNIAINSGVLVFANTTASLAVLDKWYKELTDQNKTTVYVENGKINPGLLLEDQLELNIIISDALGLPYKADTEDKELLAGNAFGNPFKLWVLPVLVATGGHVYFYQHLPQQLNITPYVVHTTFQRHGSSAKVARFREEGLWIETDPTYYDEGNFLTFEMDVRSYIDRRAATWLEKHKKNMTWHHKHMLAAQWQLALFQEALAVAVASHRTLVLPEFTCYCDQDYYVSVMQNCTMEGSDLQLPFACPADVYLVPDSLGSGFLNGARWNRFKSFFNTGMVPQHVLRSRASVVVLPTSDTPHEMHRSMPVAVSLDAGSGAVRLPHSVAQPVAVVPMHLQDSALMQVLAPVKDVRIWDLRNLVPGMFGGFESLDVARDFDGYVAYLFGAMSGWCCTGTDFATQWDYVFWRYQAPLPMFDRSGDASDCGLVPYTRPLFCDQDKLNAINKEYLKNYTTNHPCAYLPRVGEL